MSKRTKWLVRHDSERGSVTIFTVFLTFVITGAGLIAIAVMQLAVTRATLSSFADLSALAASRAQGEPCSAAMNIAASNGVQLDECLFDSDSVTVTVSTPVNLFGPIARSLTNSRAQVSARASRSVW